MADEIPRAMSCCGSEMRPLASAERSGHKGGVQRVTVYRCETCDHIDSLGESCDPGWVNAKARMFLELRQEAFQRAGLEADPAVAVFELPNRQVIFG